MNTSNSWQERDHLADMEFLTRFNISLTSNHNYRTNITEALHMIGRQYHHDRIHVLKIYPDMTFTILYEWCDHCAPSIKNQVRKRHCFYDEALQQQLNEQAYIWIEDPEQLSNPDLRAFYKQYTAHHILLLPLLSRNFFAFLAFSQCKHDKAWSEGEIHLMSLLSAIIAANLEKNLLIAHLMQKIKS